MKKSKANDGLIDRELQMVSPELLLGYEKKNLRGSSLREMNYRQGAARRMSGVIRRASLLAVLSWSALMIAVVIGTMAINKDIKLFSALVFVWVASVVFAIPMSIIVSKGKGLSREAEEYEQVLGAFITAVENLFGIPEHMTIRHDESGVHNALVFRATKVLKLEEMFNDQISALPTSVEQIVGHGDWLIRSRNEFEDNCRCAESFGLNIDRGEVYRQARRLIKK